MTFRKDIRPSYETIGRRRRIAGYIGEVTDETGLVLHSQEYANHHEAEVATDSLVRELLTDYCEQGLIDDLPAFDGSSPAPGGILVVLVDALIEDEETVPTDNPDVGSTTGTYGPNPARQPIAA